MSIEKISLKRIHPGLENYHIDEKGNIYGRSGKILKKYYGAIDTKTSLYNHDLHKNVWYKIGEIISLLKYDSVLFKYKDKNFKNIHFDNIDCMGKKHTDYTFKDLLALQDGKLFKTDDEDDKSKDKVDDTEVKDVEDVDFTKIDDEYKGYSPDPDTIQDIIKEDIEQDIKLSLLDPQDPPLEMDSDNDLVLQADDTVMEHVEDTIEYVKDEYITINGTLYSIVKTQYAISDSLNKDRVFAVPINTVNSKYIITTDFYIYDTEHNFIVYIDVDETDNLVARLTDKDGKKDIYNIFKLAYENFYNKKATGKITVKGELNIYNLYMDNKTYDETYDKKSIWRKTVDFFKSIW